MAVSLDYWFPDNLKTGVDSNKKYEDPVLNKSYQEMADHYGTTVIPAGSEPLKIRPL